MKLEYLCIAWVRYKYRLQETYDVFHMWRHNIVYGIPYLETIEESTEFFFDCLTFYDEEVSP